MPLQNDISVDLRESLANDRPVGRASLIQLPREAVTRLSGLLVDLDANILRPNPWFPPTTTAEEFYRGIAPVLDRHPVLRYAEIRDTGRWLHAIVRFQKAVELKSAREQRYWTAVHKVLMGSVPSDPSAPALIALTRPVGSTNSKTGKSVQVRKPAVEIPAAVLTQWSDEVNRMPFLTLGRVLFGDKRVTPCPYCEAADSHLDLGDIVGFCYGPCQHIPLTRLHEPFLMPNSPSGGAAVDKTASTNGRTTQGQALEKSVTAASTKSTMTATTARVITIEEDTILEIDPSLGSTITMRVIRPQGKPKD